MASLPDTIATNKTPQESARRCAGCGVSLEGRRRNVRYHNWLCGQRACYRAWKRQRKAEKVAEFLGHRLGSFTTNPERSAHCLACGRKVIVETLLALDLPGPAIHGDALSWRCGPDPRLRL
jgi:hypothetical protein